MAEGVSNQLAEGQVEGKSSEGVSDVAPSNELDLVFCLDCTGSMGSYIDAARENIINIAEKIVSAEKVDVRFGLVAYRDHPPQDTSYITKVFKFTPKPKTMRAYLSQLSASGGGDGPEAVTAALHAAMKMEYRESATKIAILIADAPPHGLGCSGDGFPNGDPDGKDPLLIARQMLEDDIIVYTVACEPGLGGFRFGRDFFAAIARITEGQFLPLSCADLLNDVIIGGALEEISLERLRDDVDAEVEALQAMDPDNKLTEEELVQKVMMKMQARGVRARKVKLDILYENFDQTNVDHLAQAATFKDAVKMLDPDINKKLNFKKTGGSSSRRSSRRGSGSLTTERRHSYTMMPAGGLERRHPEDPEYSYSDGSGSGASSYCEDSSSEEEEEELEKEKKPKDTKKKGGFSVSSLESSLSLRKRKNKDRSDRRERSRSRSRDRDRDRHRRRSYSASPDRRSYSASPERELSKAPARKEQTAKVEDVLVDAVQVRRMMNRNKVRKKKLAR